jgi:Protein of unknown function (DUF2934)
MTRIVTGLFDKRRDLDLVVEHLVQEFDIPRERIQVHALDAGEGDARSPQDSDLEETAEEPGLPDGLLRRYAERVSGKGTLLVAWVDDAHLQRALDACREYGAREVASHEEGDGGAAGDGEERTRVRAYHLWEKAGRPEGRDQEFWHDARRQEGDEGRPAGQAAGNRGTASGDRSPDR